MELEKFQIVTITFDCILVTLGVAGNAAVVVTYLPVLLQRRLNVTHTLVLALAIGDLLYCTMGSPLSVSVTIYISGLDAYNNPNISESSLQLLEKRRPFCQITNGVVFTCEYYVLFLHALIAVNRYCCICQPAGMRMTTETTAKTILTTAILGIIMGALCAGASQFSVESGKIQPCTISGVYNVLYSIWAVSVIGVLTSVVTFNSKLIQFVRCQQNKVGASTNKGVGTSLLTVASISAAIPSGSLPACNLKIGAHPPIVQPQNHRRPLGRMTSILLITSFMFAISWIPSLAVYSIPMDTQVTMLKNDDILYAGLTLLKQLVRLNHAVNPVIYAFMSAHFRRDFRRRLGMNF